MSEIVDNIILALEQSKKTTVKAVEGSMEEVEKLNIQQLKYGLDGNGNTISPSYGESYGQFKLSRSSYQLDGSIPDLFLSGDFYKSIRAKYKLNNTIFIDSDLSYARSLKARYGEAILKLAPVSIGSYSVVLYNRILKAQQEIWK